MAAEDRTGTMTRWSDEEWDIIMTCQDQAGHGYDAHALTWSNHSLRYEPTLCVDCQGKIYDLRAQRQNDYIADEDCR